MSALDAENFPPIPADVAARERAVAVAAEGLSFDDVVTGEIPVRGVRVKLTPDVPAPVPVAEVAGIAGTLPPLRPVRHRRGDGDDAYRALVAVSVVMMLVPAAVLAIGLMIAAGRVS